MHAKPIEGWDNLKIRKGNKQWNRTTNCYISKLPNEKQLAIERSNHPRRSLNLTTPFNSIISII